MTDQTPVSYAVYTATSSGTYPVGTVINVVLWDGVSPWTPPEGCLAASDPTHQYPIGSLYPVPASSP